MKSLYIIAGVVLCLTVVSAQDYGGGNGCRKLRKRCNNCEFNCRHICDKADRVCSDLEGASTSTLSYSTTTYSTTYPTTSYYTSPYSSSTYYPTTSYYTTTDKDDTGYFSNRRPVHRRRNNNDDDEDVEDNGCTGLSCLFGGRSSGLGSLIGDGASTRTERRGSTGGGFLSDLGFGGLNIGTGGSRRQTGGQGGIGGLINGVLGKK